MKFVSKSYPDIEVFVWEMINSFFQSAWMVYEPSSQETAVTTKNLLYIIYVIISYMCVWVTTYN